MRTEALLILATVAFLTSGPALAQTYDPNYPICLQAYRLGGGYVDCSYTSLAQCNATASGRSAQCYTNPYFAYTPMRQQSRRVY
jgi:uncharacterized protein DUF3551